MASRGFTCAPVDSSKARLTQLEPASPLGNLNIRQGIGAEHTEQT